jgi:hypothetical protein
VQNNIDFLAMFVALKTISNCDFYTLAGLSKWRTEYPRFSTEKLQSEESYQETQRCSAHDEAPFPFPLQAQSHCRPTKD